MNFLFLVPRYHTNMHYTVKALIGHGHKVSMLALYRGESENYSILQPEIIGYSKIFLCINSVFNKSGGKLIKNYFELKYSFPPIFKLFLKIKKSKADILVIKSIHSIYSLLSMIIGRCLGKKIIILMQIDKYRRKPKSYSIFLVEKIFNAKVITPLLGNRKYKNNNKNLFYIPFVINVENFEKEYFKDDKINIICVGKFQKRKDQLLLVKAVKKLRNEYNLRTVLVGQEDEKVYTKKLLNYIKDNNLDDIVLIKKQLDHKEIFNEYKSSDLFILPSWHEPAAFSPLEAMSCKLPVISSDDNGTKCYIKEGENGYIFKHKNLDDLVAKIKLIISDRNNIIKMGEASFRIAKDKHSLENFYQEFIKPCS